MGASPITAICPSTRVGGVRFSRSPATSRSWFVAGGACARGRDRSLLHEQRRAWRPERGFGARGTDCTSSRPQARRARLVSSPLAVRPLACKSSGLGASRHGGRCPIELQRTARPSIKSSWGCSLLSDPAPDVLSAPDRDALRQLHRSGESACVHAPPQGGLGDGDECQHLPLAQETGFRQGNAWHHGRSVRRLGGRDRSARHHRPFVGAQPAEVMTCSAAVALGQEARQPLGNAGTQDHRERPVGAVDEGGLVVGVRGHPSG